MKTPPILCLKILWIMGWQTFSTLFCSMVDKGDEVQVWHRCQVTFTISDDIKDKLCCDVMPMNAENSFIGRPWMYDKNEIIGWERKYTDSLKVGKYLNSIQWNQKHQRNNWDQQLWKNLSKQGTSTPVIQIAFQFEVNLFCNPREWCKACEQKQLSPWPTCTTQGMGSNNEHPKTDSFFT